MAIIWAWLSDGPFRGARWPFIHAGAVITVSYEALYVMTFPRGRLLIIPCNTQLIFSIVLRQMPLYKNIGDRKIVYYLSQPWRESALPRNKSVGN